MPSAATPTDPARDTEAAGRPETMATFILLTRLSPQALHQPRSFATLERHVAEQVHAHCPEVKWLVSYALLGPWDYLDVI